ASKSPSSPVFPARPPRRGIWKCASPKTVRERYQVTPIKMPPATLFSAEEIQERVRVMARTIAGAKLVPDIAMPVLVGGFVFAADLVRALAWEGVSLDIEMIWLRSYGD